MRNLTFTCAALALAGCALEEDTVATSETSQKVESFNGIGLNGIGLNGIGLNGIGLNGIGLNGIGLNGIGLNGIGLNGIGLNGTSLDAAAIVGSTWSGQLTDGGSLELRIDSLEQGTGANADLGLYAFAYRNTSGWQPLCGLDGSGAPIRALAVAGTWDLRSGVAGGGAYTASDTHFTLACRGKSIAKCVEMGYRPATHAGHMQACVRMLRGDFCGDGAPHTLDGQNVDVYDNLGIQVLARSDWEVEAEWTASGARCVSRSGERRFSALKLPRPACINVTVPATTTCAQSFGPGSLIIDRVLPVPETTTTTRTSTKTSSTSSR